jgi:glycosyltransferase involved in cell wall biosynthesis
LRQRAAPLGARVLLLGNTSQDDIARLCAAADVIAVPSIRDQAGNVDGLPNFALEALASGTPVVATRVGGLPSAIEDGVTGCLVESRDSQRLAEAILAVMHRPDRGRALGDAARRRVQAQFGWARYAERLDEIYGRVSH